MEFHSFPDHLLVVLRGELDAKASARFRAELVQLVETHDLDLQLDLGEVLYADSGAVNLLLTLHRLLLAKKKTPLHPPRFARCRTRAETRPSGSGLSASPRMRNGLFLRLFTMSDLSFG